MKKIKLIPLIDEDEDDWFRIVNKWLEETEDNSIITLQGIPNCCKNCPNHPTNGGSGICNCAAPYFKTPLIIC